MTKTNQSVKFIASTTEVNRDTDVLVEDVRSMGASGIVFFVDEALDRQDSEIVYVVDADMVMAENVAAALNAQYEKEMENMKDAKIAKEVIQQTKEEVDNVIESTRLEEKSQSAVIAEMSAAKKFYAKHSGKLANAQIAKEKKEETIVEKTAVKEEKKATTRRVMGSAKKEDQAVKTSKTTKTIENKEEKEMNTEIKGGRRSAGRKVLAQEKKVSKGGARKLGRSESISSGNFKKFEGPWYLNAGMYEVINRLDEIIENMANGEMVDAELGIQRIALVDPSAIRRYKDREDLDVIVQVKANGNILEFPIKENSNPNSNSDLKSSSIGWVETKNGVRPAFGHWRANEVVIDFTCTCGKEFKANTGNVYCKHCKTRHEAAEVSVTHELDVAFNDGWVFEVNPNLFVPTETLALVMALAQYDADLDMHGTIEEDAE